MKPDELPEDINNPKPEESGEVTFAIPSSLPDSPPISGNFEELIIPQDASTPEKIPIIESENKEDKEEKEQQAKQRAEQKKQVEHIKMLMKLLMLLN